MAKDDPLFRDENVAELSEDEMGPPIELSALLDLPPRREFFSSIRGRIHRNLFAGQMTDLGLPVLVASFLQFLEMLFTGLGGQPRTKKDREEGR